MNCKPCLVGLILASIALSASCDKKPPSPTSKTAATPPANAPDASGRCPHEIKHEKCPFCNPSLVESEGFCAEHGFAEALCVPCRPYLKAAFRAKGDWCKEHSAPESQCLVCHPELKDKMKSGAGHGTAPSPAPTGDKTAAADACEHTIATSKCPFCTPSLIQSDGFCTEHDIAEALCVKCRPFLEAAFKSKSDWCAEHTTPESQCVLCNPDLKNKPKGK
jgi:cobalt-zinc-cadmium efflux system membrane fusion protein